MSELTKKDPAMERAVYILQHLTREDRERGMLHDKVNAILSRRLMARAAYQEGFEAGEALAEAEAKAKKASGAKGKRKS
jgi:hypothetical protein